LSDGPYVVDTNVVVAGLLTREASAPTALILDAMLAGALGFLLSEELLAEYRSVLLRPKIRAAHQLSETEIDEILVRLATNGRVVAADPVSSGPLGDRHLFALLAAAPRARVVSGDTQVLRHAGERGLEPRALAMPTRER
jgi:uncharacterized protein